MMMMNALAWFAAVQNERDRISSRRPSYEEPATSNGLTISVLFNAETMSRQVNWLRWRLLVETPAAACTCHRRRSGKMESAMARSILDESRPPIPLTH